jgi:hypothetical protein
MIQKAILDLNRTILQDKKEVVLENRKIKQSHYFFKFKLDSIDLRGEIRNG